MNHEDEVGPGTMTASDAVLVSVFIQSYNYEGYVRDSIESILQQSYQNFELLIIDDGSTDKSANIIRAIAEAHEHKIAYVNLRENLGITATYNEIIPHLKGDLFVAISSDDLLPLDALEKRVGYMLNHPNIGLFVSDFDVLTVDGKLYTGSDKIPIVPQFGKQFDVDFDRIYDTLLRGNFIQETAVSFNLRNIDKAEIFYDGVCPDLCDYDQLLRLSLKHRWGFLPESTLTYRWHGKNMSAPTNPNYDAHEVMTQRLYVLSKQLLLPQTVAQRRATLVMLNRMTNKLYSHIMPDNQVV